MGDVDARAPELAEAILGRLARRHSTATVLFHHAVADRLGLGPADHKCLDLLLERGPMTGSELAAITGLTSGAVSGVVARLEQTGWLRRVPHPDDGRKQLLSPSPRGVQDVQEVFETLPGDAAPLLDGFDADQLAAIAQFLTRATDYAYRRAAVLRADKLLPSDRPVPAETSEKGST
jgi:DNA-binding MarR family transcriptional regulator